jgi:hypothetical protein
MFLQVLLLLMEAKAGVGLQLLRTDQPGFLLSRCCCCCCCCCCCYASYDGFLMSMVMLINSSIYIYICIQICI